MLTRISTERRNVPNNANSRVLRRSKGILNAVVMIITISLTVMMAQASSGVSVSSLSYNEYQYDQTTPQFTPDGRLLQVEYATAACEHSNPLLICQYDADTMVLLTIKTSSQKKTSHNSRNQESVQDRIVHLPITGMSNVNDSDKNNNNIGIVVAMSGVLADNIALLRTAWEKCQNIEQMYGDSTSTHLMLPRIVQEIGNSCQAHSFGGGIRPYGSTMLVCGLDHNRMFKIYQTDPSGAIYASSISIPSTSSKNGIINNYHFPMVLGGSVHVREKITKDISNLILTSKNWRHQSLSDFLITLTHILLQQQEEYIDKRHAIKKSKAKINYRTKINNGDDKIKTNGKNIAKNFDLLQFLESKFLVEAVVLSRRHGVHRLNHSQVSALLQSSIEKEISKEYAK